MSDHTDNYQELIQENAALRKRIQELEHSRTLFQGDQEALRESEERYSTLSEASYEGILIHDHGKTIDVNSHFVEMFGYTLEELKRMSAYDLIVPEYQAIMLEKINHGDTGPYEVCARRKDGSTFIEEIQVREMSYHGKQVRVAACRDITKRKRVEETLRHSRNLLDETQRLAKIGGWEWDVMRQTMTWTNETYRIHGFLSDEFEAGSPEHIKRSLACYDPEDRPVIQAAFQRCVQEGQPYDLVFPLNTADGRRIWIQTMAQPVLEGNRPIKVVGNLIDITERRRADQMIRESEEKFRSAVERSLTGIAIVDDAARYIYVNEELCRITGYSKQELLGRNFAFLLTEESQLVGLERYQRRQRGEDVPSHYEFSFIRKNGSKRFGEVLSAVYMDSAGKLRSLIQVIDITERKAAEEEKLQLYQRLNRAEKMEALGRLAGGVAHDLNNVLGIMVGYSEIILDDIDQSSPIRPHVAHIKDTSQKAAAIVQDLLTLARRGVQKTSSVNLNTILLDYQKSPEFEKLSSYHPHLQIQTECQAELPNIMGSKVHLEKTIANLISNAAEAMPKGGLISLKTSSKYLDRPVHGYDEVREDHYVVLTVSDTGEGISAQDTNRIFEPFYTKKVMGRSGTGLGLAVVWGTVKDHNGYIVVQSELEKGTIFTLYFPVTKQDKDTEKESIDISAYRGKGESILVVDDVPGQRELASTMLRKLQYDVHMVAGGEEAVEYLKTHKADLVVLDMIMDPGIDGLDTYQRILEINPTQKAIIVSGFSETDRVRSAQRLGAGAYVKKPYVIEKLGLAVKKELDKA